MDSYTVTMILDSSPWKNLKVFCLVTCSGTKITSKAFRSTYKRFVPSPDVETSKAQGFGTSVIPSITPVFSFFSKLFLKNWFPAPFLVVQASNSLGVLMWQKLPTKEWSLTVPWQKLMNCASWVLKNCVLWKIGLLLFCGWWCFVGGGDRRSS